MSWDDLVRPGVTGWLSEPDTARFSRPIARITVGDDLADVSAIADEIANLMTAMQPELAVVRWPARLSALGARLVDRRLGVVPAETLMYWESSLPVEALSASIAVDSLSADPRYATMLPRLVRDVFDGYHSHYSASPELDPGAALDGYVEWAVRTASANPHDTFVAHDDGRLLAFATTAKLTDGTTVEVELAGTRPREQRRGVYRSLLNGVMVAAGAQGAGRLIISTQAANAAVQRSWVRLGLRPFAAYTTVHLRPESTRG
jgi:GNAT superfamily N-acetyltransferase